MWRSWDWRYCYFVVFVFEVFLAFLLRIPSRVFLYDTILGINSDNF